MNARKKFNASNRHWHQAALLMTAASFLLSAPLILAQTNQVTASAGSNSPASAQATRLRAEKIREACIVGRRIICGRILQVLPGSLVVESGYVDLLRPPLNKSWLVPGNVVAHRSPNLLEAAVPGSPCVGVVLLTDLPKIRRGSPKPKPYDYVLLLAYPTGQGAYLSAGTLQKSVRQFSANLSQAVIQNFNNWEKAGPVSSKK